MKYQCDTKSECGQRYCDHQEPHECGARDGTGRHVCEWLGIVRCNPVEEPAKLFKCACAISCPTIDCSHNKPHECHKPLTWDCPVQRMFVSCIPASQPGKPKLCPKCGADLGAWKETLGDEHRCDPPQTDLTSPLRPLKSPELYRCTKAAVCKIEDCSAFPDHTHDVPVHGPRECGFLLQKVECEKVGEQEPLKGVYFSGKVVETLSMLRGMDPAEWDKLWGMVTGKTERLHKEALEIMADANGPASPKGYHDVAEFYRDNETQEREDAEKAYQESVRAILVETHDSLGPVPELIDRAVARIVKLPRIKDESGS